MPVHRPADADELAELIAATAAAGGKLQVQGGGSLRDIGASTDAAVVEMGAFHGIVDYDPAELVLTAGAATPLAEIEALLAQQGQMLAFEPFDHGPVFGRSAGGATLGGSVAAGVAGSRRLSRGGARDHLLGFKAVSGRGEAMVGGAKVVKNVTGYDLPKLMAASWGRLAALTEVTLKVLPRAPESRTLALDGLDAGQAWAAMARALGAPADVAAAAHDPAGGGLTALRLEGFGPSVEARSRLLAETLAPHGRVRPMAEDEAARVWETFRALKPLAGEAPLWRIIAPARAASALTAGIARLDGRWLMDWAGGLVWASTPAPAAQVRAVAEACEGRATLFRADEAFRRTVPAFHPRPAPVAALEARVRRAFDPAGVFETGRFEEAVHAD